MDKNKKLAIISLGVLVVLGVIIGICVIVFDKKDDKETAAKGTPTPTLVGEADVPEDEENPAISPVIGDTEENFVFTEGMPDLAFSKNSYFYTESFDLKVFSRNGGTIYYTLDGTNPTTASAVYDVGEGIPMEASLGTMPNIYTLRVLAVYDDGSDSGVFVHSYFVGKKVDSRYKTLIFSITGDPADLTEKPDGIFYRTNVWDKGREFEKQVFVEVLEADGTPLLAQFAGIRIYGGVSRESYQKSMKLYARKTYDPLYGSFRLSCFDQLRLDGTNTQILNYDKIVLRNSGNDFQFAFIRDELNQTLAVSAGIEDYEACLPAVCIRNGEYVGFYWLHASYCNDYFMTKYGDNPANVAADGTVTETTGEFVILEGSDTSKKEDEDDEVVTRLAADYDAAYEDFVERDVTNDAVYKELCQWMDVENYLDYFAYNIYLCNKDWPNNNYKCYRYFAAEDESYTEGTNFDGRWRYLLHDIDYTLGLYDQTETRASYDTLKEVMRSGKDRYSPLFTALMKRPDCIEYFVKKMLDYANGALSSDSIINTLNSMNEDRSEEMEYYYNFLVSSGDSSVWTQPSHFADYTNAIKDFATYRPARSLSFLKSQLDLGDTFELTVSGDANAKLVVNSYEGEAGEAFDGTYFQQYDTTLSCIVSLGTAFDYWEVNGVKKTSQTLTITAADCKDGAVDVVLHVKADDLKELKLYEVSAKDSDFVTIWNPTQNEISLKDYSIKDGDFNDALPADLKLAAGETLTLYCNNFEGQLPVNAVTLDFNLAEGEEISLLNGTTMVDTIKLPKLHSGFVYRFNSFTRVFEETTIE